jgi:hypothetical protein
VALAFLIGGGKSGTDGGVHPKTETEMSKPWQAGRSAVFKDRHCETMVNGPSVPIFPPYFPRRYSDAELNVDIADETSTGTATVNPDCTGTDTIQVFQSGVLVRTTTLHWEIRLAID